ncbi:hypothetical protein Anas_05229 [Armadillidium nasatum]|uniref:Uncharacterized protein n=1 Tax=Armadillidium nasatum TaxID=96803 RepID=A0A5N5TMU9_9CRUS|nr:hypothetical protein Anas_05229 [Armadillidium nasatum]
MFDTDTLLQDETRDTYTFETREAGVISVSSTMPYGKGYPLPKTPTHYLPPNSTNYSYRRPSKYGGGPQRLKPPPSPIPPYSTNQFYSPDATPSLNSFTSYPSKQPNYNGRSTPHYPDAGPYPRYSRNRQWTTTPPYQPSGTQQSWWKKILRREKRQADLNDLCPARADYIMPRAAQRVDDGDWMFLVNVDEEIYSTNKIHVKAHAMSQTASPQSANNSTFKSV